MSRLFQSVEKLYSIFFCGDKPHFCFYGDMCGRNLLISENRFIGGFQGHVGGIGGSVLYA